MLKSAFNYLADAAGVNQNSADGSDGNNGSSNASSGANSNDPIVGSRVDVGGVNVRVVKRIGEGGFAFVYSVEAEAEQGGRRKMALKRLLAVDQVRDRERLLRTISNLEWGRCSNCMHAWICKQVVNMCNLFCRRRKTSSSRRSAS